MSVEDFLRIPQRARFFSLRASSVIDTLKFVLLLRSSRGRSWAACCASTSASLSASSVYLGGNASPGCFYLARTNPGFVDTVEPCRHVRGRAR